MNDQNLKSNDERTPSERRELAAKAGRASGASRRRKKSMKEWAKILGALPIKVTLPAMGNEFIAIIKESSVLYAVGVYELTYQANKLASVNYRYLETMIVAALIYFVLTYTMTKLLGLLERRMRRSENSISRKA